MFQFAINKPFCKNITFKIIIFKQDESLLNTQVVCHYFPNAECIMKLICELERLQFRETRLASLVSFRPLKPTLILRP
jgi:hypothetical protein